MSMYTCNKNNSGKVCHHYSETTNDVEQCQKKGTELDSPGRLLRKRVSGELLSTYSVHLYH